MKNFKVKLIWETSYEVEVKAINKEEAEAKSLEAMENGECKESDSEYLNCEVQEI